MTAIERIIASPDPDDGWRWPRASQFPEQGPYENVSYTRTDIANGIREAALREAYEVTRTYGLESGDYIGERILALIGEKK
jgi:hypothetical protein